MAAPGSSDQSQGQDPFRHFGKLFDVPLRPDVSYDNNSFDDGEFDDDLPAPQNDRGARYPPDYGTSGRRPIPVQTISQCMVPFSGVHFLSGLERVEIQQTVELEDLLASVESENRYVVRVAEPGPSGSLGAMVGARSGMRAGETLLVAAESSAQWQRRCLGSHRGLQLRVYDPSRQEALNLSRRLACSTGLLGCCYLQCVDVVLPPGKPLGTVKQAWTLLAPVLEVRDQGAELLYRVEGPGPFASGARPWSCAPRDMDFKITSADGLVELGAISHRWKVSQSSFLTTVIFPDAEMDVNHKALLLSAAFLLEYMFFESAKKKSWFPCFC